MTQAFQKMLLQNPGNPVESLAFISQKAKLDLLGWKLHRPLMFYLKCLSSRMVLNCVHLLIFRHGFNVGLARRSALNVAMF